MILSKIELNYGQYLLCGENQETKEDLWLVIYNTNEDALKFLKEDPEVAKIFLTESKSALATNLFWAEYHEEPNVIFFELDGNLKRMPKVKERVLKILEGKLAKR